MLVSGGHASSSQLESFSKVGKLVSLFANVELVSWRLFKSLAEYKNNK